MMTRASSALLYALGALVFAVSCDGLAQTTAGATTASTSAPSASTTTSTASTSGTTGSVVQSPGTGAATGRHLARVAPGWDAFAGSEQNFRNLVDGLRSGQSFTLTSASDAGAGATVVTTPTGPMGYGEITRTLYLARRELAADGITQPTPRQLQAALTGGTVTTANGDVELQGVLTLRSQHMGWGKIAHAVDVAPARAASSAHPADAVDTDGAAAGTAASLGAMHGGVEMRYGDRGIVNGLGSAAIGGASDGHARGGTHGVADADETGDGAVTTALGHASSAMSAAGRDHGMTTAMGAVESDDPGIVSASGHAVSATDATPGMPGFGGGAATGAGVGARMSLGVGHGGAHAFGRGR